ncbi:MAG: hypothetical protein FWF15_09955 [Oscillospiraceae bacterium]|nr:hypothetical protein [Oscillospiraceae bacterium]
MKWENFDHARDNFYWYDLRSQFTRYVYDRSNKMFRRNEAMLDAIASWDEIEARQRNIKEDFEKSIGGLPLSDHPSSVTTLNPRIVGTIECGGFRIEKIIFESRPHSYVTANMYIPGNLTGPAGTVLFVCGHHEQAKHAEEYQIVCRHMVQAGLVVFAMDPVGQGERMSYYDPETGQTTVRWGTGEHEYVGAQCFPPGDCIARYFMHDIKRSIDYLCTRPEVNPEKIGITGNSGGGTQSSMAMLCERRLAAAAPGTFIMNREEYMYTGIGQDAEQLWPDFTLNGYDHEDILLAMAPKPVLVLAVAYDFFPIEGTKKAVENVKRFWKMRGKEDDLELFVDMCDHHYTPKMATRMSEFFSEHLNGNKITPDSAAITTIEPSELWCTESGQVKAQFPGARFVYEENQDRLKSKSISLEFLKSKVLDCRVPCDLNNRVVSQTVSDEYSVMRSIWRPQEGLFNHAYTFRLKEYAETTLPVTIAIWDGGTSKTGAHGDFIARECSKGRAVVVLDVSGTGAVLPYPINCHDVHNSFGTLFTHAYNLIWMGDSLPAMRTYDVIRAIDNLHGDWKYVDTGDIKLYLHGRYGYYGWWAAKLDGRIKSVESDEPYDNYESWIAARHYEDRDIYSIVFPGVLK